MSMNRDDIKLVIVCYYEAFREYGHYLPDEVSDRLNSELLTIINNHESGEWCMLWWIWTHCSVAQDLTFARGMEASFVAYLFGISNYDPFVYSDLKLKFKSKSLFDTRRAIELYHLSREIRDEMFGEHSEDKVSNDLLYLLCMTISPFSIEDGETTITDLIEELHLDSLLDGKLDECDTSDVMAMRSYMKDLSL